MAGDYSGEDLLRMQQDAAKRVKEMQARSRFAVDHTPALVTKEATAKAGIQPPQKQPEAQGQADANPVNNASGRRQPANHLQQSQQQMRPSLLSFAQKKSNILEMLHTNSDTVLLMALLFVLYTEQADELLMLAVLYIML